MTKLLKMELLEEINYYKQKTFSIEDTENFDDLKEMEVYDYQIVSLIYDFCIRHNYSIEDYPQKYLELIENDDEDFDDFLSYDVKYYFGLRNALIHNDVFLAVKAFYTHPDILDYTDEECIRDIQGSIEVLEQREVNLVFIREDYNTALFDPKSRPKLP